MEARSEESGFAGRFSGCNSFTPGGRRTITPSRHGG
ncbi:hypothetical protein LINPERPRIM_LOCUS24328 [Linum perenne]